MSRQQLFREAEIVITNRNSDISVQNARTRFDITKSMQAKENITHVNIFNLGKQTREAIAEGNSNLILRVGYRELGNLTQIIKGDIVDVSITKSQSEVLTSLSVVEGARRFNSIQLTLEFNNNPTFGDILDKITKKTGYQFKTSGVDKSAIYGKAFSDMGSLDQIMRVLSQRFEFRWSLQNNVITIFGIKELSNNVVMTLNSASGLLINPEAVHIISNKFEQSEEIKTEGRKKILSLLQPSLQIGDVISVESKDINGNFRIVKLHHTGDNRANEWYSHIEID